MYSLYSIRSMIKLLLKKNLNASRSSEHPRVRGENVETFRWLPILLVVS